MDGGELYDILDVALTIFSVNLNEDKKDDYSIIRGLLKVNETFIPKKDENGDWINFPYENNYTEVDLDNEYLPETITYDDILHNSYTLFLYEMFQLRL